MSRQVSDDSTKAVEIAIAGPPTPHPVPCCHNCVELMTVTSRLKVVEDRKEQLETLIVAKDEALTIARTACQRNLAMYVVKKDRTPVTWASGDLSGIAFAGLVIQDLGLKYLNGDVE